MARLLLLLLLPLPLFADGLADAAKLWVDEAPAALRALPVAKEPPTRAEDGAAKLGEAPLTRIAAEGFDAYLHADGRLWIWITGDEGGWRGPKKLAAVTRKDVLRRLERHTSDSGQQGFYRDRFAKLASAFGPQAVAHLIDIAEKDNNEQLQQLAIEALGQLGYAKRAAPALKRLIETARGAQWRTHIVVSIARLGDSAPFDALAKEYSRLAALEDQPKSRRAGAAGLVGLLWARLGKYDKALEHYFKATEIAPELAGAHYNLACTYARLKRADDAFKSLNTAVDKGFDHWEWMRLDGDLASLRKDPRWKTLLARQFAKKAKPDEKK